MAKCSKKYLLFKYGYFPIPAADPQRRDQSTNVRAFCMASALSGKSFGVIGAESERMPKHQCLWQSRGIKAAKRELGHGAIREQLMSGCFGLPTHLGRNREPMKDFSHASFSPDVISIMQQALEQAVATLPHPLRSTQVQSIAENILRGTKEGERNPTTLKTMALLEFQLRAGEK